jgi:hypothetical protein
MMGERQVQQDTLFYEFSLERHVPDTHTDQAPLSCERRPRSMILLG